MTPSKLFLALAIGFGAAACHSPYETRTVLPPAPLTASEQACVDYGFTSGSVAYDRCVGREQEARARGRVARDYAEVQLSTDAHDACYSYGLQPGTASYDRCVGREIDARRYRDDAGTVYTPAPPPAVVYTTPRYPATSYPAPGYPAAPYVETRNNNTVGVPAFKDEYGFRYDAQGNRLDRNGNIISPQSTQP
jgi:hypothetical protein